MGIISRFKDIMASNINALLDKAEDPAKMIDQMLRNLRDDLQEVKAETAGVMAEEAKAKRQLDECNEEIAKLQNYAMKAVEKGNDQDARQFLAKKSEVSKKLASLQQAYDLAKSNADKMKQMHDKLFSQINELEGRRDAIKAKISVAKTQEKINNIGQSANKAMSNLSEFDRLEEKANKMLDSANAMAELNNLGADSAIDELTAKYDLQADDVEDELAALKRQMGAN